MPQDGAYERLNLTDPAYPAPFLKTFGNDGVLPYKIKCVALGVAVWILGYVHAYIMDVLDLFLNDIIFLTISILVGITLILVMHVCKEIDPTLRTLNDIFQKSDTEFKQFIQRWNLQSPRFYYLCLVVFAAFAYVTYMLAFFPVFYEYGDPAPWIRTLVENGTAGPLTYVFASFIAILAGVVLGVGFNRVLYFVRIIDDYGKRFINSEKIDLRRAILPEELTSLAKLAIKIDMIVAVPTTISAWIFFKSLLTLGLVNYGIIAYLVCSMLLFVFFSIFPLRHLHRETARAKHRLIKTLDKEIQQANEQIRFGIQGISLFHDLLSVRDQVRKMSTWGINTGLLIRFFMAGFLPLVIGALLQIWFQLILFP